MDVSCPRCRTEYELDDARVPGDGVTVKCTQCAHVFRVKRKEMVLTLPAKPEDAANAQAVSELPPPPPSREWKVRQPNGNIFACRELTTLQKWIVEGKVGRDAEISLSGDTWKRLGNIPELASFFQIVDEASKGRALEALRSVGATTQPNLTPLGSSELPTTGNQPKITDTWKEQQFATPFTAKPPEPAPPPLPQPPAPVAQQQPPPPPPPSLPPQSQAIGRTTPPGGRKETIREPAFASPPPPPSLPPVRAYAALDDDDDDDLASVRPSRRGVWLVLVLVGLGIGGGLGYYFGIYLPELQRQEREAKDAAEKKAADEVRLKAEAERAARDAAEKQAREDELDAAVHAAAALDAGSDGGSDAGLDAGAPDAGKAAAVEAPKTYDWYVAQGDRLRDREKPEQAITMYGHAADLSPDSVEPIAGKGLALLDLGQALAAQSSFETALKLNPRYGPAIMGMAEAFRAQNKNDKAVEWYQRYLDVLPDGNEANVARNNIERLKK